MEFVLHIGLPKTATTTLQDVFFAQHSQIQYIGKAGLYRASKGCMSERIFTFVSPLLWNMKATFEPVSIRETLLAEFQNPPDTGRIFMGSWEGLAGIPEERKFREMIKRVKRTFDRVRIMVTLRNPVSWIVSVYLQQLASHFVKQHRLHLQRRVYVDFEEWLGLVDPARGGKGIFSYGKNIRAATEILGKDNIGVFLFEDFQSDPVRFGESVSDFLGINSAELGSVLSEEHLNARLTSSQMAFIHEVDSSWLRRTMWQWRSVKGRRRKFKSMTEAGPDRYGAKVTPSAVLERSVGRRTADFNRWVVDQFGLELGKYGYPL